MSQDGSKNRQSRAGFEECECVSQQVEDPVHHSRNIISNLEGINPFLQWNTTKPICGEHDRNMASNPSPGQIRKMFGIARITDQPEYANPSALRDPLEWSTNNLPRLNHLLPTMTMNLPCGATISVSQPQYITVQPDDRILTISTLSNENKPVTCKIGKLRKMSSSLPRKMESCTDKNITRSLSSSSSFRPQSGNSQIKIAPFSFRASRFSFNSNKQKEKLPSKDENINKSRIVTINSNVKSSERNISESEEKNKTSSPLVPSSKNSTHANVCIAERYNGYFDLNEKTYDENYQHMETPTLSLQGRDLKSNIPTVSHSKNLYYSPAMSVSELQHNNNNKEGITLRIPTNSSSHLDTSPSWRNSSNQTYNSIDPFENISFQNGQQEFVQIRNRNDISRKDVFSLSSNKTSQEVEYDNNNNNTRLNKENLGGKSISTDRNNTEPILQTFMEPEVKELKLFKMLNTVQPTVYENVRLKTDMNKSESEQDKLKQQIKLILNTNEMPLSKQMNLIDHVLNEKLIQDKKSSLIIILNNNLLDFQEKQRMIEEVMFTDINAVFLARIIIHSVLQNNALPVEKKVELILYITEHNYQNTDILKQAVESIIDNSSLNLSVRNSAILSVLGDTEECSDVLTSSNVTSHTKLIIGNEPENILNKRNIDIIIETILLLHDKNPHSRLLKADALFKDKITDDSTRKAIVNRIAQDSSDYEKSTSIDDFIRYITNLFVVKPSAEITGDFSEFSVEEFRKISVSTKSIVEEILNVLNSNLESEVTKEPIQSQEGDGNELSYENVGYQPGNKSGTNTNNIVTSDLSSTMSYKENFSFPSTQKHFTNCTINEGTYPNIKPSQISKNENSTDQLPTKKNICINSEFLHLSKPSLNKGRNDSNDNFINKLSRENPSLLNEVKRSADTATSEIEGIVKHDLNTEVPRSIINLLINKMILSQEEKNERIGLLSSNSQLSLSFKKSLINSLVHDAMVDAVIGSEYYKNVNENQKMKEMESLINPDSQQSSKLCTIVEAVVDSNMPSSLKEDTICIILNKISSSRSEVINCLNFSTPEHPSIKASNHQHTFDGHLVNESNASNTFQSILPLYPSKAISIKFVASFESPEHSEYENPPNNDEHKFERNFPIGTCNKDECVWCSSDDYDGNENKIIRNAQNEQLKTKKFHCCSSTCSKTKSSVSKNTTQKSSKLSLKRDKKTFFNTVAGYFGIGAAKQINNDHKNDGQTLLNDISTKNHRNKRKKYNIKYKSTDYEDENY